jgi:hypothetical protein
MNIESLTIKQKDGKLIDYLDNQYLDLFSEFFADIKMRESIIDVLVKLEIVAGIAESILLYMFVKLNNKYDLPLLIDCLLDLTAKYISKEAIKFVHGKISSIIKLNLAIV